MLNGLEFRIDAQIGHEVASLIERFRVDRVVARIWERDSTVWTGGDESKWLGWLDVIDRELPKFDRYRRVAEISRGFDDVVLTGMGGSSLAADVLSHAFGKSRFHVLDSIVPQQVISLEDRISPSRTLFIVASKSGTTLEPELLERYFAGKLDSAASGSNFIAVTDPDSKLFSLAQAKGFAGIVPGEPEIGGRFSALSPFGMTPAAAMGLDIGEILMRARLMQDACREEDPERNPGAILGLILGAAHSVGRNKLSVISSPKLSVFGAWLEQLIAESTGKDGKAVIPIDGEPRCSSYADDRLFVILETAEENDSETLSRHEDLIAGGQSVIRIRMDGPLDVGQEFYRWEFATAVAGAVLGVNPFDQPDVESAKLEARRLTEEFEEKGVLSVSEPFFTDSDFEIFASDEYAASLSGDSLEEVLRSHVSKISDGDYFAVLAYLERCDETLGLLQHLRAEVLSSKSCATTLGFGPRFLHSTGQAHKGGPNSGVFLQISALDSTDVTVPGLGYSLGVAKDAQAFGDFEVLKKLGRRALHIRIRRSPIDGLKKLIDSFK
jgi:transaldolase / glucose-6-phosphate isomerase